MKKYLSCFSTHLLGPLAGAVFFSGVAASAETAAHYRFEGGPANEIASVAVDSSPNGRDMTAVDSPVYRADVPVATLPLTEDGNNLAIDFSGGNHRFAGSANDSLSQVVFDDFTLEAWIRHTALPGPQTYIGRDDQGGNGSGARPGSGHALVYFQKGNNNQVRVEIVDRAGELRPLDSGFFPQVGTWYHVAAVGNATTGTLSLYVDGVLQAQRNDFIGLADPVAQGTTGAATPWSIGRGQWDGNPADFMNGQMDEVRISTSALSPAQFLNFADERIEITAPPNDLVVWSGQAVTFTVQAALVGSGELSYQWEQSVDAGVTWEEIGGATMASYTIAEATLSEDRNLYRVQITNGNLDVTSDSVLLRVGNASGGEARGLVAQYRFEGGPLGGNVLGAIDSSLAGYNLNTVIGTPTYSAATPVNPIPQTGVGNELSLDLGAGPFAVQGTDGDALSLVEWEDFTLEAWVRFNDLGGFQTFVGRDDRGTQRDGPAALFYFQKTNINDLRVDAVGRNGQSYDVRGGLITAGVWHHVAAVGDVAAGTLSLYLNGNLVASNTNFNGLYVPANPTLWSIGRGQFGANDALNASNGDWLNGQIDEVRFSNVALSRGEFLSFNSAVLRFAEQPSDITAAVQDEVVFASLAAGGGQDELTYQWQVSENEGGTWVNIPGANSASFTIASATLSLHENQYRVLASRGGVTEISDVATLQVFGFPQPVLVQGLQGGPLAHEGGAFTFSVVATGLGELSYQWQRDGIDLPGEEGSELVLSPVARGDEGTYTVVISDDAGVLQGFQPTTTTVSAFLAVAPLPRGAISLNFVGTGSGNWGSTAELAPLEPYEVAGAVPVANWNNSSSERWISTQATPLALRDDTGALTEITATWSAANTWSARLPAGSGNTKTPTQRLFHGFIEARPAGTDPATVTISNIPFQTYDVYVYPMSVEGGPGEFARSVTLVDAEGTRELFMRNLTGNPTPEEIPLILSHATTLAEAEANPAASYFRFAGATGDTLVLRHFDQIGWNSGGFAAVSIVDTSLLTPAQPTIVSRPAARFLPSGSTATLAVSAQAVNAGGSLAYHWEKDGVQIASGASLSINNVTSADNGYYTAVVTETSNLGVSVSIASAQVVVTDGARPVLINADMQFTRVADDGDHLEMVGAGILRTSGPVVVDPNFGDTNPFGFGEGPEIWNRLALARQGRTYLNLVDSEGLPLPGLTFVATGATGAEDATVEGAITNPIESGSGPLLRDYIFTNNDDVMTLTVGGMEALAGREVTLVVYALGKESVDWPNSLNPTVQGTRNDVARVTLAAQNSVSGLEEFGDTNQAEGRDLAYNSQAYVIFNALVALDGTLTWTVGPVPGEPGLNAFNGFQLLVTDGGEGPVLTALQAWGQANFGRIDGQGNAALSADPDGDGFNNLLEYALGSDPTQAGAALDAVTVDQVDGFLTLTFSHIADPSLIYAIEASDNLSQGWTVVQSYGSFATTGVETYTDTVSVGSHTSRFLRLNVAINP